MAKPSVGVVSKKRKHGDDTAKPVKRLRGSEEQTSASEEQCRDDGSSRPTNKHTRKERKQNRSTRVHSLRKQLARGSLPSTVQQEKERELAALLHEQDKTKTKMEAKKTLEKYHYVRFVERQKAEKRLKQLRKHLQSRPEDEALSRQIHEMEVNRNYAIYAPLDQKYISIFAQRPGKVGDKRDDLQDHTESKPPMWEVVAETMTRGQPALEALRDGKVRTGLSRQQSTTELNEEEPSLSTTRQKQKAKDVQGAVAEASRKANRAAQELGVVADDDMSDGGFFDR
ncbi:rRNA-processing protein efg1 [Exophiala xenobiotica]|uniref:rRNA-processing protein EFG1 n=1 Tax=Lithohypha guttulata TaxID=1690604 RepID=A0ABR0KK48_9EURO|nr:rRNA-processing protein efg1 [Lithohypha guttulata]KAK5325353.1 rRNA-processing protein efg1 [Exophiala xenobiotica]